MKNVQLVVDELHRHQWMGLTPVWENLRHSLWDSLKREGCAHDFCEEDVDGFIV